jgi:hypothetical protein
MKDEFGSFQNASRSAAPAFRSTGSSTDASTTCSSTTSRPAMQRRRTCTSGLIDIPVCRRPARRPLQRALLARGSDQRQLHHVHGACAPQCLRADAATWA